MSAPSPQQQYLRQQYAAQQQQQQQMPSGASWQAPQQHSPAQRAPSGGMPARAATSSSGSLPEAWVRVQAGVAGGADAARAGPPIKHGWSDDGELPPGKRGYTCCTKFRFAIWVATVAALIAAAVGLSVVMAVVMHNRDKGSPAPPPPPGGGGDDAGGGSESGGSGNLDPLPPPVVQPDWVPAGQRAIWWDDFDGGELDPSKWAFDLGTGDWGWGNNEQQTYTDSPDNVRVADGNLYITALKDGNTYTSARLTTKPTASFYPGMRLADGTAFASVHVEARLQLPAPGQGLWPAFWMFPTELKYGKWAASGEIDIMESVNDFKKITQGLHYGGSDPNNVKSMVRTQQDSRQPFSDAMHTVAADWEAGKITLSVDGKVAKTYRPREKDPEGGWYTDAPGAPPDAPFNEPFYLILNLAVGGLWPGNPDASTPFPATLTVDYVRVYGKPL